MFFARPPAARPVRRRRTPPVAESRTSVTSIVLATLLASVVVAEVPATRPAPAPAASAVPERAVASITVQKLDARLRFLTNDLLEGRVVGRRGNAIAEIFLAAEFERLGLPGVNVSKDGPYYQPFEMVGSTRAPGNRLVIREGPAGQETARTYEIGPDLSPMNFSSIKEASGDLVFAGYGITAPKIGYDDYQGIDATGKIVVVLDGAGKLGLTDVSPASKVATAQAHGAAGVLAVPPLRAALDGNRVWPEVASPKVNRFSLPERADNATIPVANISVKLAEQLLGEGRSVPGLMKALDEKRAPGSFGLPGKRATLAVNLNRRRVTVRNLIALMEGTDPKLKNELVVIGAHFDANGINVLHLLGYSYCPDVARVVIEENRTIGLDVREDYDQHVSNLVQRSDHWSFLSQGIPAVFLHTGLHPDYHMPTDTIEKINFPKFVKIARLAFRVAWRLATQAERPQPPLTKKGTD